MVDKLTLNLAIVIFVGLPLAIGSMIYLNEISETPIEKCNELCNYISTSGKTECKLECIRTIQCTKGLEISEEKDETRN